MGKLTHLLESLARDDPQAAVQLIPPVYDELRRLAALRLQEEPLGQRLEPAGLVHDAYLRLVGDDPEHPCANRGHFFTAAAEAMRRMLLDRARTHHRARRGGGRTRGLVDPAMVGALESSDDLIVLDEALKDLATLDPQAAAIVNLRYFAGLTIKEAAAAMGIPPRTAELHWSYARAQLLSALR
jgi:RNA polymerase sigma factor (TIGR02999 family)